MSLETKYRAKPARVIEFNKYIFLCVYQNLFVFVLPKHFERAYSAFFDSKTSSGVYDAPPDKQVFVVSGDRVVFVGFEYFCRKEFG